jgi:hypothetical protein
LQASRRECSCCMIENVVVASRRESCKQVGEKVTAP